MTRATAPTVMHPLAAAVARAGAAPEVVMHIARLAAQVDAQVAALVRGEAKGDATRGDEALALTHAAVLFLAERARQAGAIDTYGRRLWHRRAASAVRAAGARRGTVEAEALAETIVEAAG